MDVKTYVQQQVANSHQQIETVMKDVTDEQFNWLPAGTINPISATLVHVVGGEDFFIQTILQGKRQSWELQEWSKKIGVQAPPGPGHGWDEFKSLKVPVAPALAYAQAVREATNAYLETLTADELDRQVEFAGRPHTVGDMLMITVVHTASHAGEIAAVKGMQGLKGLPF